MKDFEYLQVVMNVAHLRSNPKYKEAELMRRKLGAHGAAAMAKAPQELGAICQYQIAYWHLEPHFGICR